MPCVCVCVCVCVKSLSHVQLFETPWRREWQSTPVFLPWEFHGQRSLADYSSWGCKKSDMTEQLTLSHFSPHNMIFMSLFTSSCLSFCYSLCLSLLSQIGFFFLFFLICENTDQINLSDLLFNCDFLLPISSCFFSI